MESKFKRNKRFKNEKISEDIINLVCQDYLNGVKIEDICKNRDVSSGTIYDHLHLRNISTKAKKWSETEVEQMYSDYQNGLSKEDLSEKYKTYHTNIKRLFDNRGLKSRTFRECSLIKHYGLNGEQTGFIRDGYQRVKINGKPKGIHQLIWSAHNAGVQIPKGMVVHHINGDKLDNRIENLTLLPAGYHNALHFKINRSNGKLRLPSV